VEDVNEDEDEETPVYKRVCGACEFKWRPGHQAEDEDGEEDDVPVVVEEEVQDLPEEFDEPSVGGEVEFDGV